MPQIKAYPVKPKARGRAPRRVVKSKPKPRPRIQLTAPKVKKQPSSPLVRPITAIRSASDLQHLAESQVDTELSGQIQPLQSQSTSTQARETAARADLEKMFGGIQTSAAQAAQLVSDNYDKTNAAEQAIFSAAGERLNNVKQSAAAEAQALAQKMGGPVAVGDFTDAVEPSLGAFGAEKAGALLHGLGAASAGVQEAANWSGKVFPLMMSEKIAASKAGYDSQIKEIEDHIAQLKGTRGGAVSSRFNELQTSERQYQLQQAQTQLEKLKANRDWQATIHTLKNDDKRLALASQQYGLDQAGVTGKYKGKPTLEARKLTADQKIQAAQMGLSAAQFSAKLALSQESNDIARQRVNVQAQKNSMQMINALINPTGQKAITLTHKQYIPKNSPEATSASLGAISGKRKDVHWDPKKKQWYYYQKESMTQQQWAEQKTGGTPITDAKQVYQFLINQGIKPALARTLVRQRLGKDPVPGKGKKKGK